MNKEYPQNASSEVSNTIVEEFLEQLTKDKVSETVIGRLKKLLLEERDFTETAIKTAILFEEKTP
jgi:hypothetical protein